MPVIATVEELNDALSPNREQFLELWVESASTSAMCALVNGDTGWLMYLRENGDAGFSSRNPQYCGAPDAEIRYRLDNGQVDVYPSSWALPLDEIRKALGHFIVIGEPAPWLTWHNDSGDGVVIGNVA